MRSKTPIVQKPSWHHQRLLRNLLYNLVYELDMNTYEVLPYARFDDAEPLSDDADLIIIDLRKQKAVIILQLIRRNEFADMRRQLIRFFGDNPNLREAFLVDYESQDFYRLTRKEVESMSVDEEYDETDFPETEFDAEWDDDYRAPSYSFVLRTDLGELTELGR